MSGPKSNRVCTRVEPGGRLVEGLGKGINTERQRTYEMEGKMC